jgi:capsular exopolysaccharide synthesis family protein
MREINNRDYYGEEEKPIDIHELLNKFLRRKNLFLYIAIPVFFIIFIVQFTKAYSPIYRATFDIGVVHESQVEGFFSSIRREAPITQIGTVTQRVIANLLSVNLAEKVVDTLNLYTHIKDGSADITIVTNIKRDFEKPIGPLKLKIADGKFSISENGGVAKEGLLNEYIDLGIFELKVIPVPGRDVKGKIYEITIYPRNKIAIALRNSLAIKVLEADKIEQEMGPSEIPFSGEGASKQLVTAKTLFPGVNLIGILRINVHWGNPDDALKIAEVLSKQIIREDVSEKSRQYIQSRTFIDSQLTLYQNNLTRLEEDVKTFKESKKIANLGASTQSLINQVSDLESRKNQLQIEQKILIDMNEYLAMDAEKLDVPLNFAATLISDPVLQNFYSQLLTTEAELKGKLKEYSSGHPKVLEIKAKLGGLKEQMREEVTKRMSTIKSEIASVANQISMLQSKLENVPDDEIQLARLERDRGTAEKLYTFFAGKLEETRVEEAGVTSDLKIINPPLVSPDPVNSRRPVLALAVSLIISLVVSSLAVFIAEYVDNTVKEPEALKMKIGLTLYGSIPQIIDEEVKQEETQGKIIEVINTIRDEVTSTIQKVLEKIKGEVKSEHLDESLKLVGNDVSSAEFEAFRKLAVNLDFAAPEEKYRVLYLTSPGPEEGKTFVSINLAIVLGTMGKKVLLMDTDFRKKKGHLTDITKLDKEQGLFDILMGDANLRDTIIPYKIPYKDNDKKNPQISIDLLLVGNIPPNPFIFLESEKMQNLINSLKEKYDYVVIDGVPVLLFADATYLANFCDGVLITARYGKTGFKELENTKEILQVSKTNIIGLVMNSVPRTPGTYYYHYYHKYYSKYYKKD